MSALETQALGMVPIVIEQSGRGERAYDIYSRLLRERLAQDGQALIRNMAGQTFGATPSGGAAGESFLGFLFGQMSATPFLQVTAVKTEQFTLGAGKTVTLGKLPIVVNDSRGFFTSRVFGTFVMEGAAMLGEGIPAAAIENAAMQAGLPVGPLAVLDETEIVYALRLPARRILSANLGIGSRLPAHLISLGRVLLAALPPEERQHPSHQEPAHHPHHPSDLHPR